MMFCLNYLILSSIAFQELLHCRAQLIADLYWSMDDVEGMDLYPSVGNRTRWKSQLNVSDLPAFYVSGFTSDDMAEIIDGYIGNGLLLDEFNLIVGIPFNSCCLFDVASCEGGGITVGLWMFIRRWTNRMSYVFASATHWNLYEPGVALYEDLSDQISFKGIVILTNGLVHSAAFNRTLIERKWSHVTLTWSANSGIKLYLNGKEVTYTQNPTIGSNRINDIVPHLNFGSNGADVILDEIGVWYRELSSIEVEAIISQNMTSVLTTSPNLTTTVETTNQETSTTSTQLISNSQSTFKTTQGFIATNSTFTAMAVLSSSLSNLFSPLSLIDVATTTVGLFQNLISTTLSPVQDGQTTAVGSADSLNSIHNEIASSSVDIVATTLLPILEVSSVPNDDLEFATTLYTNFTTLSSTSLNASSITRKNMATRVDGTTQILNLTKIENRTQSNANQIIATTRAVSNNSVFQTNPSVNNTGSNNRSWSTFTVIHSSQLSTDSFADNNKTTKIQHFLVTSKQSEYWTVQAALALFFGIAITMFAFFFSYCVFCCLLCGKRRKRKKRKEISTNNYPL